MTAPARLVFLHTPRTGGTTLHAWLSAQYREEEICPERFHGLATHPLRDMVRWKLFSGHFQMHQVRAVPMPFHLVTILRDPRERILSLWRYWRRVAGEMAAPPPHLVIARDAPLGAFLRHPSAEVQQAVDNAIARDLAGGVSVREDGWLGWTKTGPKPLTRAEVAADALANLMRFDLVGFTDALDAMAAALATLRPELSAASGALPRLNAGDDTPEDASSPQSDPMLDAEARRELDRVTALDRFIVDRAREMILPGEKVARPASLRVAQ